MLLFLEQRTPSSVSLYSNFLASQRLEPNRLLDINSELDELDREEFYRLKKVANKKQRDVAAADAELKAKKQADEKAERQGNDNDGPADLLADNEDDDVIF